jgi:hypothetical protein
MAQTRWWYGRSACVAALIAAGAAIARPAGIVGNGTALGAVGFAALVLLIRQSVEHVTQKLSDVTVERSQLRYREELLEQQIDQHRADRNAMAGQRERLRVALEDADRRVAEVAEHYERRLAEETEAVRVAYENQRLLDMIDAYDVAVAQERSGAHEAEPPRRIGDVIHLDGHRRRSATGSTA